ncbi:MAG: hypothetical protein JWR08_1249 [Enterovirga sp.]|jgi:hypothetical protein|nr:hypothetical protein [Enterovirga sp.]
MPNRTAQVPKGIACNDNGPYIAIRHGAAGRGNVLAVAGTLCEAVLLSYVARGSMIVGRTDRGLVVTGA